ncbi:MAG: Hydrolase in polyol utilization gene cluster, haloacid dehalogenase-like family, partial [uncultured Solirubrobacteraceae bacterium]
GGHPGSHLRLRRRARRQRADIEPRPRGGPHGDRPAHDDRAVPVRVHGQVVGLDPRADRRAHGSSHPRGPDGDLPRALRRRARDGGAGRRDPRGARHAGPAQLRRVQRAAREDGGDARGHRSPRALRGTHLQRRRPPRRTRQARAGPLPARRPGDGLRPGDDRGHRGQRPRLRGRARGRHAGVRLPPRRGRSDPLRRHARAAAPPRGV